MWKEGFRHLGMLDLNREHAERPVMIECLNLFKKVFLYLKPKLTKNKNSYFVIGMNMENPDRSHTLELMK
ncbi:hypothetical protein MRX96_007717 [Rhipicephalus microplus]